MIEMPKLTADEWHTISVALNCSNGVHNRMCVEQGGDRESVLFFGERSNKAANLSIKLRPFIDAARETPNAS